MTRATSWEVADQGEVQIDWPEGEREGLRVRRDALGLSPVWYRWSEGALHVSNDAELLRGLEPRLHRSRRARLVTHLAGRDAHDLSAGDFLEGMDRVKPGHELVLGPGGRVKQRPWWRARCGQPGRWYTPARLLERVRHVVAALEPEGAVLALSSGVDSTLLAALSARAHRADAGPALATMRFERSRTCDESERVEAVCAQLGRAAQFYSVEDVLPLGARSPALHGLAPAMGPVGHPGEVYEQVFFLRACQSAGASRVWTGVGADQLMEMPRTLWVRAILRRGDGLARGDEVGPRELSAEAARLLARRASPRRWSLARAARQLEGAAPPWVRRAGVGAELWREALARYRADGAGACVGRARRLIVLESWRWEMLVRSLWRARLATGLAFVHPFLDARLWEAFVCCPPERCLGSGPEGGLKDKWLLRRAHALEGSLGGRWAWSPKAATFDEHIERGLLGSVGRGLPRGAIAHLEGCGLVKRVQFCDALGSTRQAYERRRSGEVVGGVSFWGTIASALWLHEMGD